MEKLNFGEIRYQLRNNSMSESFIKTWDNSNKEIKDSIIYHIRDKIYEQIYRQISVPMYSFILRK